MWKLTLPGSITPRFWIHQIAVGPQSLHIWQTVYPLKKLGDTFSTELFPAVFLAHLLIMGLRTDAVCVTWSSCLWTARGSSSVLERCCLKGAWSLDVTNIPSSAWSWTHHHKRLFLYALSKYEDELIGQWILILQIKFQATSGICIGDALRGHMFLQMYVCFSRLIIIFASDCGHFYLVTAKLTSQ